MMAFQNFFVLPSACSSVASSGRLVLPPRLLVISPFWRCGKFGRPTAIIPDNPAAAEGTFSKGPHFADVWAGTISARSVKTVKTARSKVPALVLIAVVIGAIGVPVIAGQIHPICAPKQHDCGDSARITTCCCDDQSEASNQTGPPESRVHVSPTPTVAAAVWMSTPCSSPYRSIARPHTSPPHAGPLDLLTLFASLLI